MDKFTIKIDDKKFTQMINRVTKYITNTLPKEALAEYKANTPRDSGFARNNTKLTSSGNKKVINGNYAYAGVLDQGMFPNPPKKGTGKTSGGFSTQAPKGMSEPTIDFIEDQLKDLANKASNGRL